MRSTLEQLPNEILLELFEYVDARDVFHGFLDLNTRFNRLIHASYRLILKLERNEPVPAAQLSARVVRLIVDTDADVNFQWYPFVQSLTFKQMTAVQLQHVRWELLPNLVCLSTSSTTDLPWMSKLAQRLFSNKLPTIRRLDLGLVHVPRLRIWRQSPSLHSVTVQCVDPTLVPFILTAAPNLSYLHAHFLNNTIPIFQHVAPLPNHPLKRFVLSDPYHRLSFNHVHTFLTLTPNVRRIQLNFLCRIPFVRFAQSLLNRLRDLERFDCHIDDASADKRTDVQTIRELHPCFRRIHCATNDLTFRTFVTE